jgi:hypothetical protein
MTPVCPACGSVAVRQSRPDARVAACMNPRCRDSGVVKRVAEFRHAAVPGDDGRPDPRKIAVGEGSRRVLPAWLE